MKWISVKKRLPKRKGKFNESDYVLCVTESGEYLTCWLNEAKEFIQSYHRTDSYPVLHISHWMPLPEPPKED